jgi:hypothetical protein
MTTIRYQVLLTEGSDYVFASIPDLQCDAMADTPAAALAAVESLAGRTLRQFDGGRVGPPAPSRLSLGRVELPAPVLVRAQRARVTPLMGGDGHA